MTMETKRFTVPFTIEGKEANENRDMGLFSGYGAVFGNVDLGGDIVEGGAFDESLKEWQSKDEMPAMFGFHSFVNPIGDWLEMREDEKGLFVKGQLWVKGDKRIEQAVVAHNIMRGTGPKGLSIGYRVQDHEDQETERGMVRKLKKVQLLEVSVVGFSMNPKAKVEAVKSLTDDDGQIITKREMESVLRDAGLSRKQAKAFIAEGYKGLSRDDETQEDVSELLASLNKLTSIIKG